MQAATRSDSHLRLRPQGEPLANALQRLCRFLKVLTALGMAAQ